jgi:hypothetical protein
MCRQSCKDHNIRGRHGIVLLMTLVLLVLLSMLGYALTSRVAAQRHRDQYTIDYASARYGCDSGVKYSLATLEELELELISRPNEPDFSDVFNMSEEQYRELLDQLAAQKALEASESYDSTDEELESLASVLDFNQIDDVNAFLGPGEAAAEELEIPGPYGPRWPLVSEPAEFEVGSAKVTIEIEDENAKYPLGWALLDDEKVRSEARAGLETFCEWAGLDYDDRDALKLELAELSKLRPFKVEFKPITKIVRTPTTTPSTASTSGSRSLRRTPRTRITRQTISSSEQIQEQTSHFARLFHSSMIDMEALARPTIVSETRKESPLKYMGTWGSVKVNINTAPRHVLEAAFTFGGDADRIAEEVIRRRRVKPFDSIDELKSSLFGYSDSIGKCENYITTVSTFFTVKVTAVSGVAKASSVIAITKDGKKVQRVAVISG